MKDFISDHFQGFPLKTMQVCKARVAIKMSFQMLYVQNRISDLNLRLSPITNYWTAK